MTINATATIEIARSPQDILEFVLDLEKYRLVDTKITRVADVVGPDEDGVGYAQIWGKMKGLPPAPDKQAFKLERWKRLTFTGAKPMPGRMIFDFIGTFDTKPLTAKAGKTQTRLTHAYEFTFKGPFKLLEKRLGPWLQTELDAEVALLKKTLEAEGYGAAR